MAVPIEIRFSPLYQIAVGGGPEGPICFEAWLYNPTARAIKIYCWQVNASNPLFLAPVEEADLKRKPPDPDSPLPPRQASRPPMGVTIPPRTTVRFSAQFHLGGFDFKSGAPAKLEWTFHF